MPDLQREMILDAYERAGGNKSQAARLLGMAKSTYADRLHRIQQADRRVARASSGNHRER
jgi:DNA-binding NtrC family response regulator